MTAQASDIRRKVPVDRVHRAPVPGPPNFTYSGDLKIPQAPLSLHPGMRVNGASLQVTGVAFQGLLKYLSGASITASPVFYNSTGAVQQAASPSTAPQAFIVDFTGIRSILKLELKSLGVITLVLTWNGTEFSSKPAFPSATFSPAPDGTGMSSVGFAALETIKLLVQINASGGPVSVDQFTGGCRIETSVFPSNLKVSVAGRPPFFTRPGVLNGPADVTGLAQDLNALLASATMPQNLQITIATDTPGVLQTDFDPARDLDLQNSSLARFGGQNSQNVALDAMVPQNVALVFPANSSASWQLVHLELDVIGQFPVWRSFLGQTTDQLGELGLRVNAQFSVARRFPFVQDGDLYGFALLFRPAADVAQLNLQVVEEQNGQPGVSPAIASADVSVPAGQTPVWVNAQFASPVKISAQKNMWSTLSAKTGSVEWAGAASSPDPAASAMLNNGGGSWQPYPSINARAVVPLLRVLRRPFTQENEPLLSFTLESQTVTAEPGAGVATVSIDFGQDQPPVVAPTGPSVSLSLGVTALATGKMTIQKAQMFYEESA